MHSALLSFRRARNVVPWLTENTPEGAASLSEVSITLLQPKVELRIDACDGSWFDVARRRSGM
jgi:hypothetical protein